MADKINQTKQDAFERVLDARMGSLVPESTDDYILALEHYLYVWLDEIKVELNNRIKQAEKQADQV